MENSQTHPIITPVPGEPTRFRVLSRHRLQKDHLVDLVGFRGKGECSCEHFRFKIAKKWRMDEKAEPCWHIAAAVAYLKARLYASWLKWALENGKRV